MEVGDVVKVVNGNHPFAGCEVEITAIDGDMVIGTVTTARGDTETERFNVAELHSDMDTEVVANADHPRRDTIEEAKQANNSGGDATPPANS